MHNSDEKETLYFFWNNWLAMRERIEEAYEQKDPRAIKMMEKAIDNYSAMLSAFLPAASSVHRDKTSLIEPLNGKERLQFIRSKITGHFAYVQLDALYTEAMKKAVSRLAMKK
ncbi:YpoC family protein [Sporosarcina sp. 179-K 8C2 HS]|uniref:YpoC family protein n=1 Tax=Sporosarcina sp. 179-K 8C2 HS TaxID=3142387 RepID=UPI00399FE105